MADFSNIIEEINTNLPDNNTQAITAEKLRTTLIDLTNQIDTVQDEFESDINEELDSIIVDNLTSTDTDKALSANQGKVLNDRIDTISIDTIYTQLEESGSPLIGYYIKASGDLQNYGGTTYSVHYYSITGGNTYKIERTLSSTGGAVIYAVYSTENPNEFSSSTKTQVSSSTITGGDTEIIITTSTNDKSIAITHYGASYNPTIYEASVEQMTFNGIRQLIDEKTSFSTDEIVNNVGITNTISDGDSSLITSGGVYGGLAFSYKSIYTDMSYSWWQDDGNGPYVKPNGSIGHASYYSIRYFNVEEGKTYRIHRDRLFNQASPAAIYAVYNTLNKDLWSTTTAVQKTSTTLNNGELDIDITIPTGGVCLALTIHRPSNYFPILQSITKEQMSYTDIDNAITANTNSIETLNETFDDIIDDIDQITKTTFKAELDSTGENFYAAYLDLDNQTEYTYWFKKCMFNELFTFYRVGYRSVSDRTFADTTGISDGTGITYINSTASDNIGPIGFNIVGDYSDPISTNGTNGLVGGNHRWNNDNELSVKTAENHSYDCYVDDKKLANGDKMFGRNAIIKVVNYIYDPAETPVEGQTILTNLISTETVYYTIIKNNIEVSLRHKIASDAQNTLNRYYGMQSMFNNETEILTPRGQYDEWYSSGNSNFNNLYFTKANYPLFDRFVEKTNNYYQSAYLIPNKEGSHNLVDNSGKVYRHDGGKSYHLILSSSTFDEPTPNISIVWSGVYTFFATAIQDDTNVFVYRGVINGKDAIFVNTFGSFTNIEIAMPEDLIFRKMNEVERDTVITTTNTFIDSTGLQLTSTGKGSFIFTLE